jgi:WD40 repeat protein
MLSERMLFTFLVFVGAIPLVGCSDAPATTGSSATSAGNAQSSTDDDARIALKQTEAKLAASRAQVDELKRLLDAQANNQEEVPTRVEPVPADDRDFTIIARQQLHDCCVSSLAFSPDGQQVASADVRGRVLVSSVTDLQPVLGVEATTGKGVRNGTFSVSFSPDGKLFAVGSEDRTLWVWRTSDGKMMNRIRGHEAPVEHLFFLPPGGAGLSYDRQGNGLTWSTENNTWRQNIPNRRMRHAALTPDGKTLVWSEGSHTLCGPLGESDAVELGSFGDAVAITADGRLVAKGSSNHCFELWDVRQVSKKWSSTALLSKLQALQFTPDGQRVVSLIANTISVWEVRTGDEMLRNRVRSNEVIDRLAMSSDGRTIALANHQGMVIMARLPK